MKPDSTDKLITCCEPDSRVLKIILLLIPYLLQSFYSIMSPELGYNQHETCFLSATRQMWCLLGCKIIIESWPLQLRPFYLFQCINNKLINIHIYIFFYDKFSKIK